MREREERYRTEVEKYEDFLNADQMLLWAERMIEEHKPKRGDTDWDWRFCVALNSRMELKRDREYLRLHCGKLNGGVCNHSVRD